MTKNPEGELDEGAAKKKKKPAAKKPAKKPAAKKARPAKKKKDGEAEARVVDEAPAEALAEVIDAEILAETPIEPVDETDEVEPVEAAAGEGAPELTPEEQELSAIYGDVSTPATAHGEYQDRQTADEDRPMVPEINAREERKQRWEDRRERKRARREQREQERRDRRDNRQSQPSQPQPPRQMPLPMQPRPQAAAPVTNGHADETGARVGTPLGDAAATVFAQLRNNQPLPVKQLAAMMRKRSLVEADPEHLWPQLKAELLGDERSYRTLGLRPRIVYRGRDLFAPGPVAMSATADAEAGVASALSRLAGATHRALSQRIAKATAAGFERIIHAYLVAAGYRDIDWVKRVGGISYASAVAPGIDRTVLISARSGDQPIDRRGIGELRVGVEAKNLVAGILFSSGELSEDAEKELERAGRSIAVMCGDSLVAALIAAGVGVVSAAAPLHYVDDQLLDELLAG
jgi:Restriction endonuclease